jgi:hypothetical protein
MSDIEAIVIGAAVGILVAPVCALLIIALLREWNLGYRGGDFVPWSVILARPEELPELPELSVQSPLALPGAKDGRQ